VNFNQLIKNLSDTHDMFQIRAFQGVNMNLTLRNWFFGMYIVEYEQSGKDRASYGDALIKEIAKNFKSSKIEGLSFRNLNLFRKFYLIYPQIVQTASALFDSELEKQSFPLMQNAISQIDFLLSKAKGKKTRTELEQYVSSEVLVNRLSFSHFVELMKCDDSLQKTFIKLPCLPKQN